MQNNDDETAFPVTSWATTADSKGMSLRDWFAGQVMAGIWANPSIAGDYEKVSRQAYEQADAMMQARKTLG
jgi:hypothetical protein